MRFVSRKFRIFSHLVCSGKNAKNFFLSRNFVSFCCAINCCSYNTYGFREFSYYFLNSFLRKNAKFREKLCEIRTKVFALVRESFRSILNHKSRNARSFFIEYLSQFWGYCSESDMPLVKWNLTCNYVYSSFQENEYWRLDGYSSTVAGWVTWTDHISK